MTEHDVAVRLEEIATSIHDVQNQMKVIEANLSEKLSNRLNDAIWKLMPMMVSIQMALTGMLATALYWMARN